MPAAIPIIATAALTGGFAFAGGATFLGLVGLSAAIAIGVTPPDLGFMRDGVVK